MNIINKILRGDKVIWIVSLILGIISLIVVYSATSALAVSKYEGDTGKVLMKHLGMLIFGFAMMILASRINYKRYAKIALLLMIPCLALLLYTLVFGRNINDASRSINVGGFSFQPSEMAKIILITYLARQLIMMEGSVYNFKDFLLRLALPILVTAALIFSENLSTAVILVTVCMVLLFIGRVKFLHLLALVGLCIVGMSAYLGYDAIKTNIETGGNLLSLMAHSLGFHQNSKGEYTFLDVAFAQYVKGDIDYTRNFQLNYSNQLVFHVGLGIAYPYGNSSVLPFEKTYFSGGANSVRGWSVRSLGPGNYSNKEGNVDYLLNTGDMKLDLNMEYRAHLFWKFGGALFVDAGNIWTLRDYEDRPGGQFRLSEFWRQLAVSYGLGLRLNFDYFILRFDMGMKAVNPAYETDREHFPLLYPDFSRDFAFHFAVGLPF